MTILTITRRGTLRLPREVFHHLRDTRHLEVRIHPEGIILTPVSIDPVTGPKVRTDPNPLQTLLKFQP